MGIIQRQFYCGVCNRRRYPGDCGHGRVVMPRLAVMSGTGGPADNTLLVSIDVCPTCRNTPNRCTCAGLGKVARRMAAENDEVAHVRALVGCDCVHHVDAYRLDDIKMALKCGKCCPVAERIVVESSGVGSGKTSVKISPAGRTARSHATVQAALEFGSTEYKPQFFCDNDAPGFISNGCFVAFVGEGGITSLDNSSRGQNCDGKLADIIHKHEERNRNSTYVIQSQVNVGSAAVPRYMTGWRTAMESAEDVKPRTIIATPYSNLLIPATYEGIHRDVHYGPNALEPMQQALYSYTNGMLCAIVMPRRETIVE